MRRLSRLINTFTADSYCVATCGYFNYQKIHAIEGAIEERTLGANKSEAPTNLCKICIFTFAKKNKK